MNTQAMNHETTLPRPSGNLVQLAIGALTVLWAGSYSYSHLGETQLLLSGVAVHLYGLGVLVSSILQLAGVKGTRKASERILLLSGFVVWVPVVLIALRAIGIDLWSASPALVLESLAASIGLGALVAWKLK